MKKPRSLILKWAIGSFLLGLVFPALSFLIAALTADGMSIWEAHNNQPALWVTNLAPVVLTIVGVVIGGAHAQLSRLQQQTADLAERVAKEWTAEIHDNNVSVAKAAELRSKYFAALSHDMRTPIAAIMGFTDLVDDPEANLDEATLKGFMGDINDCAGQLLEIVNDLLDAAKLEAGRIELMVTDVDGDDIATQVVNHMVPLADEEQLELLADLRADVPVRADPQRFRQILINLVSNSLKYTAEGTVKVKSYRAGSMVVYEVEDTGAGISPADMPKVFTPFEQTDVAKQRLDSTGLGLPVSLGMAQAMGGTIECDSLGVGHGSVFRLVLDAGTGQDTELKMASLPSLLAAA